MKHTILKPIYTLIISLIIFSCGTEEFEPSQSIGVVDTESIESDNDLDVQLNYVSSTPSDNAYFRIRGVGSQKMVSVSRGSTSPGANVITWQRHNNNDQVWYFDKINSSSSYYQIKNYDGTLNSDSHDVYLTAANGSNSNGLNVKTELRDSNDLEQQWWFQKQADGSYYIRNRRYSAALDVEGRATGNGGNIQLWSTHSGTNQKWLLEKVELPNLP